MPIVLTSDVRAFAGKWPELRPVFLGVFVLGFFLSAGLGLGPFWGGSFDSPAPSIN